MWRRQGSGTNELKGKTVKIIIGTSAGGGVDLWSRLIAQHLGKHLTGEPALIVQNMPGGSSVVAANYIYNVAKPDGLTLGALQAGVYFDQILGRDAVKFDWSKFTWIGSPERLEAQLYMKANSPYKTLDDIRQATEPQDAVEREPVRPAITSPSSSKKLWASSSKP